MSNANWSADGLIKRKVLAIVLISAVVTLVMQIALVFGLSKILPNWEIRGQFGDSFGSVNAFFSGLAYLSLVYTLLVQQSQIKLQREDVAHFRLVESQRDAERERERNLNLLSLLTKFYDDRYRSLTAQTASGPAAADRLREMQRTEQHRSEIADIIDGIRADVVMGPGAPHLR